MVIADSFMMLDVFRVQQWLLGTDDECFTRVLILSRSATHQLNLSRCKLVLPTVNHSLIARRAYYVMLGTNVCLGGITDFDSRSALKLISRSSVNHSGLSQEVVDNQQWLEQYRSCSRRIKDGKLIVMLNVGL